MLANGRDHPIGRLGEPQARCRLPTHADPQHRLRAKRCEASAEPVTGCGVGVASTEAISVAEVMESRCRASAETIAQESSARDAEKIERAMRTARTPSMFLTESGVGMSAKFRGRKRRCDGRWLPLGLVETRSDRRSHLRSERRRGGDDSARTHQRGGEQQKWS
jgi:hypothetical protein